MEMAFFAGSYFGQTGLKPFYYGNIDPEKRFVKGLRENKKPP